MSINLIWPVIAFILAGCSNSDFSGSSARRQQAEDKEPTPSDTSNEKDDDRTNGRDDNSDDDDASDDDDSDSAISTLPDESGISDATGSIAVKRCSPDYSVPGRANIWLAGTPDGTTIDYGGGHVDAMPKEQPLLAVPTVDDCFRPGTKLYLKVSGEISHSGKDPTNADGNLGGVTGHNKAGWLGKSNVVAPINALVGVFLSDEDPTSKAAPAALSFATGPERDYAKLEPAKGQIFYIGDGKTSDGKNQLIIVPSGVSRLYLGIMDAYGWYNNTGELTGAILVAP